jgi:hypothetical protein
VSVSDTLRELLLNAERITNFLKPDFNFEPGEDMDLDDSFRKAAEDLAVGFIALHGQMLRRNVPEAWRPPAPPPPPPAPEQTREQMVETLRITAKLFGYRLVRHPPTKKAETLK